MASSKFPVAVVGMAVKLPGADSCEEFWQLMINSQDTVGDFPDERAADIQHVMEAFRGKLVDDEQPFFTGSFFKSVDKFDADVFQINPREALFIEPEQRMFLETVWELLEDAGYLSKIKGSRTGVYVGNTVNKYKYVLTENHPSVSHGNHSPFIASRVSYIHDLQGPAMMVATGCSSSLLAVHLACQGLLSGDCDMAIAGGITLDLLPVSTKTDIWNQLGITGPKVKCRAFDASAKGIAKGEGCGVVILKPLEKALSDGDHIYGILEATTANQDGHSNGITAPHPVAQAKMLHRAWRLANINPANISYFEAHGTGTELGDPIEISGITSAFRMSGVSDRGSQDKIPIGSVKANIGHLADGAAGIVALIKTLLCLHKNRIPPSVNFSQPNPHINWQKSPVYVNTSPLDWKPHTDETPRLASVSAFGLLGTNIHAVVREHVPTSKVPRQIALQEVESHLLALAANSRHSLVEFIAKIAAYFKNAREGTTEMLRSVCFTVNTSREQARFKYRAVAYGVTWDDMMHSLHNLLTNLADDSSTNTAKRNTAQYASSPNVCSSIVDLKDSILSTSSKAIATDFLTGKKVRWEEVYALDSKNSLTKTPFIPTYAFERARFWPKVGKPINRELLRAEHQLKDEDHVGSDVEEVQNDDPSTSRTREQISADTIVKAALNEALSTSHDWDLMAEENLFVLGLDSLIFTQVNGRLNASIGCDLSMAEFHMNPTFSGLKKLVEAKVPFKKDFMPPSSGHINIIHRPDPRIDVHSLLAYILDESFGKKHNWSEMEHDNLFSLGLDSLMYTHVTMKIQDALGLEMPFTMAEFHENPSFSGLFEVVQKKLVDQSAVCKPETPRTLQSTEECTEQLFPVSFAQRRLWVMQEMATNLCAYNATNCLKITGEFHSVAFLRAVNTVLARHGGFFTVFVDGQDSPLQKHTWKYNIRCEEVDLLSASDNAENLVMRLYDEDYKTPFDLQQCPLVRCKLYHLPTDVYFFTMVIHHIIFDGWSHFVFYNQVWDTYKKLYQGKAVEQAVQLPLYVDFAQEEQKIAATPFSRIAADLTYWKGKLSGPLPLTTLPGDKRRPPVFTHNGERITRFVNHDTIQALAKIFDGQHTMFMTLLSAVYVLLNRYTGANDLIVGTPIAGRTDLAIKHVIGCFINTLVLRVEFDDSLSFSEVLSEVSKVCTEAFDHPNAPFDHLVSELNLPRDTSSTPVFSVNICYHNTEMKSEHVAPPPEVLVERKLLHNNSSKWDMQFDFLQEPEGMRFTLEYYSDVFSDNYANSVVENFLSLLERVTSQPHIAISEWVTGKPVHAGKIVDQQDQLSIISGPTTNIGDKGLSALLFDSLEFHAEDSSVIAPDGSACTYKKLLTGAQKMAVFLRECCHIQSQSRVGLLLDNSPEALESILASMLSGLVYVPMDPASPKPRLEHISKESGISVIIFNQSHTALANHLQWACPSVRVLLCVDGERFVDLQEEVNAAPLMNKELWDRVATKASDDIEGGGWQSSYTGEHISSEEMHEYTENVSKKLANYLTPQTKVLEIGCASGLTTQKLCSLVGHYTATDLSQAMAERLKVLLQKQPNVEVRCMAADHVASKLSGEKFDVIIMNSVVHCFPGHNYMRRVLSDCAKLLRDDGIIFIGDIMDLKMRDKLVHSLKSFKAAHPECRTKTEWQNELFLSRQFLQTLCDCLPTLGSVTFTRKLHTIPNELTEFRFDAVFTKSNGHKDTEGQKGFRTFASQDMSQALQVYCSDPTYDFYDLVSTWAGHVQLKDEAYILYTSGTTGTPRGVIIGQEALLNYVSWAMKAYNIDKHTQIPLFSPLTFDFTVTSIFPPLLKGSTIHVYQNFQDSYMTISSNKHLTVAKFSPLQLDTILSTADGPLSVSTFILGGEELTQTLLGKLKQNKPDDNFVVWNEYGPTEATVGCVVKCFRSEDLPLKQSQLVSIGLPIDNVTVAVVRDKTNVVPVGGKGTLCISGKCLCSDFAGGGTSKQFSSSCWGWPGEQMLLTDDIVEMMPADGEMAYFGRQESNTVKVNGIRVDLMEIQQAIEINHLVQSAWISSFAHEDHTYLGAAVKLKQQQQGRATSDASWKQALISDLTQTLPSRCIPKVFVEVFEPPTNKNGKKDTPLLKSLFKSQIQAKSAQHDGNCGHASPDMAKLQRIWQSILPISHLPNPEEDFFLDLSGDSLQAIHLVRMMQEEGYRVSVTDVFQNPCLRKLIPVLQKQSRDSIQSTLELEVDFTEFRPTPIVEEYFLRERNHPDHFSLSALLHVFGTMEVNVLHKALRSVMKKHGSLRSRFKTDDEGVTQEVIPLAPEEPKIIEANIVREHDHLANEPRFITLTQNLEQSHSLTNGILVNAGLIKFKERDGGGNHSVQTYVLLVVHHAAIDIVSWQQLLQDLASALRKLSLDQSEEPVLAPCSLSFRAYCKALHTEASGIFASEIPYWKHVESQSFDAGLLVADNRQSRFLSAKWFSKSIDATSLRSTANRLGCSDEQILLTAFGRSMASFHGKPKTAICLESHGRQLTTVDSTSTVGWCTTMFPFILDTPLTADIVCQVKQVGKMIREIPNHGLGFGLLKAAGKLSMAYPKVMFVFQGSLDASTKETFDGGQYKFEHIPWIEIMLNELRQGRFHRHPDEILEFDLEIIAWIHGGELKFGCLFDRETISETLVEDVIKRAELNMNMLATRAGNKPREVTVEIIPGFNITPDCVKTVKEALSHHDVTAKQIQVVPPEQALQTLYKGSECSADITVIIPRNETDEGADEFTGAYKQFRMQRKSSQVIVVNAETIPNTAKLSDEVKDSNDQLDLLPEFVGLEFYDKKSDSQFSMPLTQTGYTYLGLSVARTIRAVVCKPRHKVITVDADYTLWTGECAHGAVSFNKENLKLQEFLLRKKKQGMLLVLLSKNSKHDVQRVFETQQEQMSLKKDDFVTIVANWEQKSKNIRSVANQLNLALDAFVFIDDNPLECEEMVLSCPEVITIQVPIEEHLAGPLLENLWTLDISHNTPEASERTEMYRDEFARQKEMQSLQIFDLSFREAKIVELLVSWGMRMTICKTPAGSLKQNKTLRARAEELLSRTNQFKMNDVNTTLSQAHDEDICWLVALQDCHGAYGIISVCLLSSDFAVLNQWVVSCRVLGREVEKRIIHEIYKESTKTGKNITVRLAVNKTARNTPMVQFLMSLGATVSERQMMLVPIQNVDIGEVKADIHNVVYTSDLDFFEDNTRINDTPQQDQTKPTSSNETADEKVNQSWLDQMGLSTWVNENWSQKQKEQAAYHRMFPVIPACTELVSPKCGFNDKNNGRAEACKETWMEVLQISQEPEETQNFLACGGDSFKAVFLISKLQRVCGIDISIMDILQKPVYGCFREVVMQAQSAKYETGEFQQINSSRHGLSAAQLRMVLMQQTAPDSTAYVETIASYTNITIKPEDVFRSLTLLHPILTSTITMDDDSKDFVIALSDNIVLNVESEMTDDLLSVEDYLRDSTPVIDVLSGPLVKFRHCTRKEATVLVVHVHHVIVDDITLKKILKDLDRLMKGCSSGAPEVQSYSSYVEWEKSHHQSAQHEADKVFWAKTFSSIPPSSSLAILPASETEWSDTDVYRARQTKKHISADSADEIVKYCKSIGVTAFQYYLACTMMVLQRYIGKDDITLAIPITTRTDVHQSTDGLFVNTVLFRKVLQNSITFTDYTRDVAKSWMQTHSHSQYPLDEVVWIIREEHGQSASTFCALMFNYATTESSETMKRIPAKHAKMPVSLDVIHDDSAKTVELLVEWADGFIDAGVAERLADSVASVCCKASKQANSIVKSIETLSSSELDLLQSFNQYPEECQTNQQPIHTAFEDHAAKNPDATAVFCRGISVTYQQLNTMAASIAQGLLVNIDQASLREKPVVIVMQKDEYAVASILGIWKAGGHFLPVAVNNKNSLKDVFDRSQPAAVIYNIPPETVSIPSGDKKPCPFLSTKDLITYPPDDQVQIRKINGTPVDSLAYIIKTSGSTGLPKQCQISHRSLGVVAAAWKKKYKMTSMDVNILQWAPISFDVFAGDLVRSLICSPGQLTICPDDFRLDVCHILDLINKQGITMAEVTPQFGLQLVENAKSGQLESIQLLILGSDVLQEHVYSRVKNFLKPTQRVVNSYGLTEATIDSSFFEGSAVPRTRSGAVPIGKPLPGVGFHVLNTSTLQPCPVGTVGELYISGDVLASGDVALVQLQHHECSALKTGDAACWLPTGHIDLLGRLDSMVKLRGFRISTTEIENKILRLVPGVKGACVVPMTNDKQSNSAEFLCAFLVLEDNKHITRFKVDRRSVCQRLQAELAYYMLPDVITIIDKVPLTANGKVNHKALPNLTDILEVNDTDVQTVDDTVTETASTLKVLLAEVMGIPDSSRIPSDRTFMELGAHSLILVRFSSILKQQSLFDVKIADLFSYPSISSLADYIDRCMECSSSLNSKPGIIDEGNRLDGGEEMAITGVGLRLPGGIMSLSQLWEALAKGDDLIGEFPKSRAGDVLSCIDISAAEKIGRMDTFKGAFLEQIDQFDNNFFKIAPGEAKYMSPEQRLFLQVATEALAEGTNLSTVKGSKIGVFVGSTEVGYSKLNHPDEAICVSGLMPGMIATRVAYQWDLKGPTMLVDTACSSSLVALQQACDSIRRNECEAALVGGVNLVLYPARTGVFGQTSILSPDFHCRAFDKDASGTAVGEGVLCLYLEPLNKALEEKKAIYGVMKGAAANSVGHGNGITAPTPSSQKEVIHSALKSARLKPSAISFIESHGTGTNLGDKIEISALSSIFKENQQSQKFPVGSAKTTLGHLDSAAGMLGVFKVLASFMYKQIAPNANFKNPNPELAGTSLYVPAKTEAWVVKESSVRVAGVSSFGLTGTNCHVILAESSVEHSKQDKDSDMTSMPLLLSGFCTDHIKRQLMVYRAFLKQSRGRGLNQLRGLCQTVASRLKELSDASMGHAKWRMVLTARKKLQLLNIMDIIISAADENVVVELAALRSDVFLSCPQQCHVKAASSGVKDFLVTGKIDTSLLFANSDGHVHCVPGVTMAIYSESRHWLEPTSKGLIRISHVEGLFDLLQRKLSETREMVRTLPLTPTKELTEIEGKFCSAIVIQFLMGTDLADYLKANKDVSFKEAFTFTVMHTKYEKLFFVMIRELWLNHLVQATGSDDSIHRLDSFKFTCKTFLDNDPETIATYAVEKYPSWADCFRFPLYCSKHLDKVLRGNMSPLSVIYPQGDLNFMYQFDKLGDMLGDVYYNMYMQIIAEYAKQLSSRGQKVRVLEVGAGVGHVTRQLLPKLKSTPGIEYWFTDLGKAFVEHAKVLFSDYLHMMKLCTFDITKNAPAQGVLGSFDIVISYNVIHTTQSVMDSVVNLKSCLGDDGTLFIIESARNDTWATLAWGLLDGWWYFKDYELRPAEPMMEPEKWEKVLQEVGFGSVHTCPVEETERNHVEKCLFLCSTKPLISSNIDEDPKLGWWESDASTFDPVKTYTELEIEVCPEEDSEEEELVDREAVFLELTKIWSELLGIDNIQADDDFNSLGGESLLAIQMMKLVRKRIGYQLEIADTFGYPTLGSLANFIADMMTEKKASLKDDSGFSTPCNGLDADESDDIGKDDSEIKPSAVEVSWVQDRTIMDQEERAPKANQQDTMLMFPGQGAQKLGMCISMKDSPEAKAVFKRAEVVLGYNILDICLKEDTELQEKLQSTEFVQVALLVGCLAKLEQLKVERLELMGRVTSVAGLSVGEFVALVYAGVISFEDAVTLVRERGRAMEKQVRASPTGMVSVFGPTCEQLQEFLGRKFPAMKISTYLADNQHTIAGTNDDCSALVAALSTQSEVLTDVIDVRKLHVAGAFHSEFMQTAADVVDPIIESVKFSKPNVPIIMNVSGEAVSHPAEIKSLIRQQLVAAVKWRQSVVTAYESGVRHYVEVAPGRVLSSIVKKRIAQCQDCTVELIIV